MKRRFQIILLVVALALTIGAPVVAESGGDVETFVYDVSAPAAGHVAGRGCVYLNSVIVAVRSGTRFPVAGSILVVSPSQRVMGFPAASRRMSFCEYSSTASFV